MGGVFSSTASEPLKDTIPEIDVMEIDPGMSRPYERPHPQETYYETTVDPESFYGQIRHIYSHKVLKTQLEQLRKQGTYDAFKLQWREKYNISRLHGGKCPIKGSPPTLYQDSDVGKWIEAACYFLSSEDGRKSPDAPEFKRCIDELIEMMAKAQQPDGYLGTYFTVVDKKGRLKNLRDMHEMYNCGHLLEAALAHHTYSGSTKFLDIMSRYIDLLSTKFGPGKNQLHGYPGHPELELAVLRLYSKTRNPKHLAFGQYLVSARGRREPDLDGKPYFVWEAEQRHDEYYHGVQRTIDDGRYAQWHAPLTEQNTILGHSVRAMYLVTAAANLSGDLLKAAQNLWADTVDNKMYPTGGVGSLPAIEGFSEVPHFLPQAEDEGGCYAETCASIGLMMVSERLLSHKLNGKLRDVMERSLLNTVLGGAGLDGKQFFYGNPLATSGEDIAERSDWFDVCCCPPNLCRTVGLLGGYTWSAKQQQSTIQLNIYLYLSAKRSIKLENGQVATVEMKSEMPWNGRTEISLNAPEGYNWQLALPKPEYSANMKIKHQNGAILSSDKEDDGFIQLAVSEKSMTFTVEFDMPIRLLSPHPATHQDTLTVSRGPIIYTAETYDNPELNKLSPHFAGIGLTEASIFTEEKMDVGHVSVVGLKTEDVYLLQPSNGAEEAGSVHAVDGKASARKWSKSLYPLKLVPFFARSNRGPPAHLRTSFKRVPTSDIA